MKLKKIISNIFVLIISIIIFGVIAYFDYAPIDEEVYLTEGIKCIEKKSVFENNPKVDQIFRVHNKKLIINNFDPKNYNKYEIVDTFSDYGGKITFYYKLEKEYKVEVHIARYEGCFYPKLLN